MEKTENRIRRGIRRTDQSYVQSQRIQAGKAWRLTTSGHRAARFERTRTFGLLILVGFLVGLTACDSHQTSLRTERQAVALIQAYEREIAPLDKGVASAEYEATQGGSPYVYERFRDMRLERALALSDPERFRTVERWYRENKLSDPYLARQIRHIYYNTLVCQTDSASLARMARLETYLYEQALHLMTAYPAADLSLGEAQREIRHLLRDSLVAVVKERNRIVRQAGYENFYTFQLDRMDQDPDSIAAWFHIFDTVTVNAYRELKKEMDRRLADRHKISAEQLQATHYQPSFFQDVFDFYDIGQARTYENKNMANLAVGFYESLGLYVRDIFVNSDLRGRPGKAPFGHCYDLDHRGDVRIFCTLEPTMESMGEMLFLGGYAIYRKNIAKVIPYLLRDMDYSVLSEGVGRIFRRLPFNVVWLQSMGLMYMPDDARRARQESYKNLQAQQLVFCRWGLLMYNFERALYEDPDQDIDALWRRLEAKYQLIESSDDGRTGGEWLTKWHLIIRPCYYHNYLLGSAVACHLNAYICDSILQDNDYWTPDYMQTESVSKFLNNKIFYYGDAASWQEILEQATGRPFSMRYYAQWLVGSEPYAAWQAKEEEADGARRRKYLSPSYESH